MKFIKVNWSKWNHERITVFIMVMLMTFCLTLAKWFGLINMSWLVVISPIWVSGLFLSMTWIVFSLMLD